MTVLAGMFILFPAALEAKEDTLVDEGSDFTKLFARTDNVGITTSNPDRYDGDGNRFFKTSGGEAYVIYAVPDLDKDDMRAFEVVTWYHRDGDETPGDMSFETSLDHEVYVPLDEVNKISDQADWRADGWRKFTWAANELPEGVKFLKIIFGDTSNHRADWAIQIGKVTISWQTNDLIGLQEEIARAEALLQEAEIGDEPGMYPQDAADDFAAAIQAAKQTANDPSSTPEDWLAAHQALIEAREQFESSLIYGLNWPEGAQIIADSTSYTEIALRWPQVIEHGEQQNMLYHVYLDGMKIGETAATTFAASSLKPQMEYAFSIRAESAEAGSSRMLGPAVLSTAALDPVPAPDFSQIDVQDFADEDYLAPLVWVNDRRGIPYYFYHFHQIANAVKMDEPHRGFIDIVVHRNPQDNQPYNARVQENHLWLAYFYTRNAEWNLYYGMPEVGHRLEAVLEHLLSLQSEEGAFSEYGWGNVNLAGTTFAVQFLGQTIRLLNEAKAADPDFPFINEPLYDQVMAAYRKALVHALTDENRWNAGRSYTNQYTLLWSAAAAYLQHHSDAEIEALLEQRFEQSEEAFISPAGFYYEADAYDMGYNLGVHMQNLMTDYFYFRNTPFLQKMIDKESAFFEWLSYNLVREPDGSMFIYNAGSSSRTGSGYIRRKDIPLAEQLPLARAFVRTQEEVQQEIAAAKQTIASGAWPNVPALQQTGGNAYNPYGLYNRILYRYHPTEAERDDAVQMLPYMASERFNHQRKDDRSGWTFTYVRRPDYYAAFNAGNLLSNLQSFGLGALWHPQGGMMISSQTESTSASPRYAAWGTKKHDRVRIYENGHVLPSYQVNGQPYEPVVGKADLPAGDVQLNYSLGNDGFKTVVFTEQGLTVDIEHEEPFQEHIPLLVKPDDQVDIGEGEVSVIRGRAKLVISFDPQLEPVLEARNVALGDYRLHLLIIPAEGSLTYAIQMSALSAEELLADLELLLDDYHMRGELEKPLYQPLSNRLAQVKHHLCSDRTEQAVQHLEQFVSHLQNESLAQFRSEEALAVLMKAAERLQKCFQ